MMLSFFFGGLLPVIAFTVVEEKYGTIWGIIAGMIFGGGEIIYEYFTQKKVSTITWGGNSLIIVLGAFSLFFKEGIWFKLQPAIMEFIFALVLWSSLLMKKSLLAAMAEKQGQQVPPIVEVFMKAMTFRIGLFLLFQAALATWAAFEWSTEAWALLKGVGFTGSFIVYMIFEAFYLRFRIKFYLRHLEKSKLIADDPSK